MDEMNDAIIEITSVYSEYLARAELGTLELSELMGIIDSLNESGMKEQIVVLYKSWIEHTSSPMAYTIRYNLGVLLAEKRDYTGACEQYRAVVELSPGFVSARINLGLTLGRLGEIEDAKEQFRKALKFPALPVEEKLMAINNLALLHESTKEYQESLTLLKSSFAINPNQLGVLYHMIFLAQKMCSWPLYTPPKGVSREDMIRETSPLAMLAVTDDPALQLSAAQKSVHEMFSAESGESLAPVSGYGHKKIRIGYLSSDFRAHAVTLLTVELLELHDRDKFEVYGFCWSADDDTAQQQRIFNAMDHHIRIGKMSDNEAADCIRSHEIDIVVDLHGLTSGARPLIFYNRPAPLQVTYLGFPGTTALPWIDYVISDKHLIPEELIPFHTEKPLYLPNCFQCSDRKRFVGALPTRSENGIPDKAFVFCSFNNNYKFTPEMFTVWMRILKRVPGSVLWLLADSKWSKDNLIREAKKHGVKKDRLIFAPRVSPEIYLARYQLADLFLDTFPFNGGTTANDALFMGLPLLTMSGRTFASRMAGSLLTNLKLPELITTSYEDYEATAVRLAHQPAELAEIRLCLAESKDSSPVFNMPEFVVHYEDQLINALNEKTGRSNDENVCIDHEATVEVLTVDTPVEVLNCTNKNIFSIVNPHDPDILLEPGSVRLDTLNHDTRWGDYSAIRSFLLNNAMDDDSYYGFFSPDFHSKTGLSYSDVRSFMTNDEADVYTFCPQPDMGAFFINVFEQHSIFDSRFTSSAQELFDTLGLGIQLDSLIMDSRHIVFSNYIMAKKTFWEKWLTVCESIYNYCESNSNELVQELNQVVTNNGLARKVFLIERIASVLLCREDFSVKAYNTFKCAWSSLGTSNYPNEAILSDALKFAHNELGHPEYLKAFSIIRNQVFPSNA